MMESPRSKPELPGRVLSSLLSPPTLPEEGGTYGGRSGQKLWTFAKGLPWWSWVLAGLAVLYLFNMASGSLYSRKLWTMLHD